MEDKFVSNDSIINEEDEFTSYVEFEDEDGNTISFEILDYFEFEDDTYAILANADDAENIEDENDEIEICVLKVIDGEDGEEFVEPDESKVEDLRNIVEKILGDGECDCDDDCDCSEHHHHHCNCGCED